MSTIKNLFLCGVLCLLTACVTPYKDPRPLAEQQAALASATKKLSGTYEILDRRGDGYGNADEGGTVTVRANGGEIVITLVNQKRKSPAPLQAACSGFDSVEHGMLSLFCTPDKTTGINFFSLDQDKNRTVIKSGALIPPWIPMPVPGDDYVLEVGKLGGHSLYYRLKKTE